VTKALKECLDCGRLSDWSRCPEHRRARDRYRGSAASRGYDSKYRRLRAEAIKDHIARYGEVCPGYGVLPHTATKAELSVDHIQPLADGGSRDPSNFQVLCLTCNKRKGRSSDVALDHPVTRPAPKPARKFLIA
jgi:5-methylcytosine-specific restriction protein A